MSTAPVLTLPGYTCTLWTMQHNRHGTIAESPLCWYILLPKSGWLQRAQIITYFLGFFAYAWNTNLGVFIKNGTLEDAILHRVVSHPGRDFFSCKWLAGVHACGDVQKRWILLLMYLLYFQFVVSNKDVYIVWEEEERGVSGFLSPYMTTQVIFYHYQWVISKPLMNECLICATRSCISRAVSAGLETSSAHSPGICSLGFTNSGGSELMNWF